MALDTTLREKFKIDADLARYFGQRDAWSIAVGAAISAALPLMLQGKSGLRTDYVLRARKAS